MGLGQLSPLGFCRKNMRHVLVACFQDVPRCPKGIVVGKGLWQAARVRRHQVLHIVGLPQGVDARLVGPLAVVVPGGVKRHVGVCQVMSQICRGAQHVVQGDRGGVCGRHQGHKLPVRPMQLPGQHPKPSRIQGAVDRGHHGAVVLPSHAHKLGVRRRFGPGVKDVVQIEVMPRRFEGVGVLAGVGRSGMAHQHGGVTAPSVLKATGQLRPSLGVKVSVWREPPTGQQGRERADDGACQKLKWTSVHGSAEPRNRFSRWGWPCSCWASSNTSRPRSNSTCEGGDDVRRPSRRRTCCRATIGK